MAMSDRRSPAEQLGAVAGERPEQDADEESRAEHPARESEPDAERGREELGDEEERELPGGRTRGR